MYLICTYTPCLELTTAVFVRNGGVAASEVAPSRNAKGEQEGHRVAPKEQEGHGGNTGNHAEQKLFWLPIL